MSFLFMAGLKATPIEVGNSTKSILTVEFSLSFIWKFHSPSNGFKFYDGIKQLKGY